MMEQPESFEVMSGEVTDGGKPDDYGDERRIVRRRRSMGRCQSVLMVAMAKRRNSEAQVAVAA
jgi:hypothetical protein